MNTNHRMLRAAAYGLTLPALLGLAAGTAMAVENQGFIYGHVTTDSGREYTGFLRWGTEEAFWDDLFHSSKDDLPFQDEVDHGDREWRHRDRDRNTIRIFDKTISLGDVYTISGSGSRVFIARFGDIERIEVTGGEDATVHMKSGSSFDVSDYSNDVGGTVRVDDTALGEIDLRWSRIESIEFMPAPASADPAVFRLGGVVETDAGTFEGFIQWDKEECLSTDLLDGDAEDGKMSIPMGQIRSIERRGRSSSVVELKDGRSFRLRDSNDVDADNRGIMVEDARYGRVTVGWSEFERLTFSDPGSSGRAYSDFPKGQRLQGTVVSTGGSEYRGPIVFDLDESENWEMLNGSAEGIAYDIPFHMVAVIRPSSRDRAEVVLRSGEELRLEDTQDVSENNDGVLIYKGDQGSEKGSEKPTYLEWDEVEEIRFD
jgi:hypothetical protein